MNLLVFAAMADVMPQVTLLMRSLTGGGAERVMLNLALGLAQRGIRVDLLTTIPNQSVAETAPKSLRLITLERCHIGPLALQSRRSGLRSLVSCGSLVQYLQEMEPPVLLSAMHYLNEIAILAVQVARLRNRQLKTRCVVAEHTTLSLEARLVEQWQAKFSPPLVRWLYPMADQILAVSQGVAKDLEQVGQLSQGKIAVVYNPVLCDELYVQAEESVDHPWLQPGQPPVIMGMGRFVKQKNFGLLIQAFALLLRQIPEARLMLVGGGRDWVALEQMAADLGLGERVAILEFVPNPAAYIQRARVLALTSIWEGLPTVIIEALALGCPVVATNCPSGPEELLANNRGRLVPTGNPQAIAEALATSLRQPVQPVDKAWLSQFEVKTSVERYADALGIALPEAINLERELAIA